MSGSGFHGALRSALRRQMANSVASMRELGLGEREVSDATSQARAALRPDAGSAGTGLRAAPLIAAIKAQVTLSELLMRELGATDQQILAGTSPGRSALHPGGGTT